MFILNSEIGDPVDDLSVATVLMVVGGQLILLRPRKVRSSILTWFIDYLLVI
jgi:hypothetical protein